MKSKITLIAAFLIAFSFSVKAQNPECGTKLSLFVEDAKAKNYDAAYDNWNTVYTDCPTLHFATFHYGEPILKHKIENSTGADKTKFVNKLIEVYENSIKLFPSRYKKADVEFDIVEVKKENDLISDEEVYETLSKAYAEDKDNFKNARALYMYFSTLVDLHKAGKKDLQEVFDVYDNVTEKIEFENDALTASVANLVEKDPATLTSKEKTILNNAGINGGAYETVSGSIDAKLGELANCDNLIPLYQKNFENKKGDAVWLRRAASRMDSKDCTDDPLFVKLVESLHQLEPSAESAFYLGILKDKAKQSSEAIKYYNEAVSLQPDKNKKAKLLLRIASKYSSRGQKTTARDYANKAIQNNPSLGNAYLLLANLYANSANECGADQFEKRAIYWKAADMARKAGQVDPSIKGKAQASANSYQQRAPNKTDIFNSGRAGQTITFKCWVGGSVKVPSL